MHHLALSIPFHSVESKLAQEPSSWLATQPCPQGFSHFFFREEPREPGCFRQGHKVFFDCADLREV